MTTAPTVSIGLPVYNGANYLPAALDCLLAQTYGDFELIISDNASTDATERICREYADRDERIVYHRQAENIGAIGNFNWVFQQARGRYFKWASHDDVCHPTFLARCVEVLDSSPDVVWCHCVSDMIDAEGTSFRDYLPDDDEELQRDENGNLQWKGHPRLDSDHPDPARRFAGVLLGTRWCVDSYGLIRRETLARTRMLVNLYGAEKVLIGELSLQGKYYHIPEELFAQRIHADASSCVSNAAAQHQFAAARNAKPFLSTRLALLRAHLGAVAAANLPLIERYRCYLVVFRYMLQVTKWKRVFGKAIHRQGVGGAGRRMLEAKNGALGRHDRTVSC